MRDFRPRLEKMYRQIVAKEVAEIRKLVDKYFPEGKRRTKSAETEFMNALQLFYGQLKPELSRTCQPLYADLSGIVVAMAAKQCGVDELKLLAKLQSTVKEYASIEAADYVQSSLGQLQKLVDQKEDVRAVLQKRITEWEEKRHVKVSERAAVYGPNWYAREAYKRAGVTKIKWVANGSKRCPFCQRLSGTVVGINDPFVGKDGTMPGRDGTEYAFKRAKKQPPIHRGCVCALVPVLGVVPEKLRASVKKCAEAADLFAEGKEEAAKKLGGEALTDYLKASGRLGKDYKFKGVNIGPVENNGFSSTDTFHNVGTPGKPIWERGGWIALNDKYHEIGNSTKWYPARDLLNAFKNIHEGKILTPMNEASFANLTHEVQHTRQKWSVESARRPEYGGLTRAQKSLMETVNELTTRNSYPEVLKELGRDAIYSEKIKKDAFAYPHLVNNFYALLARMGIKGKALDKLLADLSEINETKEVASFSVEVSALLQKAAKLEPGKELEIILMNLNLNEKEFRGLIK